MGISYSYNEIADIGKIRRTNEDESPLFTREIQNWDSLKETLVKDLDLKFKDKIASKITIIKDIYLKDKIIMDQLTSIIFIHQKMKVPILEIIQKEARHKMRCSVFIEV